MVVLADAVEAAGIPAFPLLREVGIAPELLTDPDARIPVPISRRAWERAVHATGNPQLGLQVAQRVKPDTFHALGRSLMACATLREMLNALMRYSRVFTDAGEMSLGFHDAACHVDLHVVDAEVHPASVEAVMATMVRGFRLLLGPQLRPREVWMQHEAPRASTLAIYADAFLVRPRFSAPHNRIVFAAALLDLPSRHADADRARSSAQAADAYLARLGPADICNRVRLTLVRLLHEGEPDAGSVARALALSERSLQRRLADAGTSFRELLNVTRREQACLLLRSEQLTVGEIAHRLGFGEPSNFTRAFRRWTGCSPTQWREQRRAVR